MNKLGSLSAIKGRIAACREQCKVDGVPFHADALAAAVGISYEQLCALARGEGTSQNTADLLRGTLQECTAAVLGFAMQADAKQQAFWMWYLRNRCGFFDKGEAVHNEGVSVTFVGEGRI